MMLPLYEGLMTIGAPAIELLLSKRVKRGKEGLQIIKISRLKQILRRSANPQPRQARQLFFRH